METTAITDLETAQAKIIQLEKELAAKNNELHQQKEELEYTNFLLDEVMGELEQYHGELSLLKKSQSVSNDNVNQVVDQDTWQETQNKFNQALELLGKYQQQLDKVMAVTENLSIKSNSNLITNTIHSNITKQNAIKRVYIRGCPRSGNTLMLYLCGVGFTNSHILTNQCIPTIAKSDLNKITFATLPSPEVSPNKQLQAKKFLDQSDAAIIFMVRDPRDVLVSEHGKKPGEFWVKNPQKWINNALILEKLQSHPRVIVVKYENLVSKPNQVQKEIAEKLGFTIAMPFRQGWQYAKPTPDAVQSLKGLRKLETSRIGNWQKDVNKKEYVTSQLKLYPAIYNLMENLGYVFDEKKVDYLLDQVLLLMQTDKIDQALSHYIKILKAIKYSDEKTENFAKCINLGVEIVKKGKFNILLNSYQIVFAKQIEYAPWYYETSISLSKAGFLKEAIILFRELPKPPQSQLKIDHFSDINHNSSVFDQVWKSFNQSVNKSFNLSIDLEQLQTQEKLIQEHFQNHVIQVIPLWNITKKEEDYINSLGLSLNYINLIIKTETITLENIYTNFDLEDLSKCQLFNNIYPEKRPEDCQNIVDNLIEFPKTVIRKKFIYTIDPGTGKVIKSNQSFLLDNNNIIYRFSGEFVFYILAGTWTGKKIAIYIPQFNLIMTMPIHGKKDKKAQDSILRIFENFRCLSLVYSNSLKKYLFSIKKREIVATLGFIPNLGHFFWQDINGLYNLQRNYLLEQVDSFLVGNYEYFSVQSMFPEINSDKLIKTSSDVNSLFNFCLLNNYLCVRVTEHFMTNDYINKIHETTIKNCNNNFLKKIENIKKVQFPLLWINLRTHNKSWIGQESGYANIINKLSDDFPNIGIVFDGYKDCNEIVENIIKLLNSNINFYNTLGCSIYESIVWGKNIDAYIAVVGSGLVITSWLNDKPGIAYGDHAHLGQKVFWSKVKENSVEPLFLETKDVIQPKKIVYANYRIDWRIIYNRILSVLKNSQNIKNQ